MSLHPAVADGVPVPVPGSTATQLTSPLPPQGTVFVAVAAYLAIALLAGVAVGWGGLRYYRDSAGDAETAANLRRLRHRAVVAGWLLAAVATYRLDVATVAYFTVSDVAPVAVAAIVGPLLAYLLPLVPVTLAVRLATVPYQRTVRGLRLRYRDVAAWELERDGVGLLGILAAATVIAMVPAGWPRVLAAVGIGLLGTALAPVALVVALRTRFPTADELAALDDVLAGTRLRVVDDRTRVGSAFAAGIVPGVRYVFLTESLFDVLEEDQLRAVAAHEVGHHERNHVLLRFSLVAVAAGGALALTQSLPANVALVAVVGGAVPFALVLAWVVRVTERGADAYAAETVSGPALAGALERLAERRYIVEGNERLTVLSYHPPLSERVAALRGEARTTVA